MEKHNKRLAACENEVKDFHPLLLTVFRKAHSIKHVEYTHGTNEKGADFVLTRHDATLDTDDYIGVIAKVGALSKTDVYKLGEQIDDCRQARYTLSGKRSIRLTEIWIITNSTISNQAEEKINENFKGQKIQFIDCDRLIILINKWFPSFWSEISYEASSYFDKIKQSIAGDERRLALVSNAADIYITPTLYHERPRRNVADWDPKTRSKADWEYDIASNSFLLIEADAGGGKSKLLRHMAITMASPDFYQVKKLVPIPSTVKSFIRDCNASPEKLVKAVMGLDFSLLETDKSVPVLLLDGLDECASSEEEMCSILERLSGGDFLFR